MFGNKVNLTTEKFDEVKTFLNQAQRTPHIITLTEVETVFSVFSGIIVQNWKSCSLKG